MASCVSCGDGKKKNEVTCCGSTVTETTTKVTKTGGALCDMPTGAVQYIGARYVPVFADPVEWTADRPYEHLMLVQHQGDTYISRQAVPIGVALNDADYWVHMSDWNAQIEQYREEVQQFDGRITQNANDIDTEIRARIAGDDALAVKIDLEEAARIAADERIENSINALEAFVEPCFARNVLIIGDSWSSPSSATVEDGITWDSILKNVNPGMNIYNKAVGGSGLLTGGNNSFSNQVIKASEDAEIKNETIDTIIVVGCINDWRAGHVKPADYSAPIRTLADNIKTHFPNAKTYFFFASCLRPRSKDVDESGNWQDIFDLNEQLCRFINVTMPSALNATTPNYRCFQGFNITHCFTEQTFKTWGDDYYLFHLSKFGQWQLYKAITIAINTGETPKVRFNAKVDPTDSIVSGVYVSGYYTDTVLEWDCVVTTREATTESGQTFVALPDSAFTRQSSETTSRFLACFTDIFPQTNSIGRGWYVSPESLDTSWNPLRLMSFPLKRTRNYTPLDNEPIMFFAPESVYPNADNHGIYIKYGGAIPASTYAGHFKIDFKTMSADYSYIE